MFGKKNSGGIEEWLESWVNGYSTHFVHTGECVPDFSCCYPSLRAPVEVRRLFLNNYKIGHDYNIQAIWAMFISCLMVKKKIKNKGILVKRVIEMFGNA